MKRLRTALWIVLCGLLAGAYAHAAYQSAFDFDELTLVDSVQCATDTTHAFEEYPEGISEISTVLGRDVRTLANHAGEMKYFAYRLGAGGGLRADRGYVLRIVYPEDSARSFFILNRGSETMRGFHTGRSLGDGMKVPYVNPNTESLELPLSGEFESWNMLFYLQERYPGLRQPRGSEFSRDQIPDDGFWVICLQLSADNDPLSAGVAVERIELYEAPPEDSLRQTVGELPPGLPRRHLFWREEMSDGVILSDDASARGFEDEMTWYRQKFRLMQFLGMHTVAKDLLEFGANQGWDSSKYGGNSWVYQSGSPQRWSRIVRGAAEFGFQLLPYYEYAGSKGSDSLGFERRAEPLAGRGAYTHVTWSEAANIDVTDPDAFEDLRKMLEITVVDEQAYGDFAGIWLRSRISDIPVSFADATRARFETDTGETGVTRERLRQETELYQDYRDWWNDRRKSFLRQVRDYLRAEVHPEMDLLFTADSSEAGKSRLSQHSSDVIAEAPERWSGLGVTTRSLDDALAGDWQLQTLTSDWANWGGWEWHHAIPHPDPSNFVDEEGILLTQTVNRAYTLDAEALEAFTAADGLATIRHYSLNEDATEVDGDKRIVGYFVADVDYAGPFVMLPEALAFARGDPRYFGYLASNNFNRGNPYYVRRFNANFLSLPALPSSLAEDMSVDLELVVRRIDTAENGSYLGAVHTGRSRREFTLKLPESGHLVDAVSGNTIFQEGTELKLWMDPCELRAFRYFPGSANVPPEVSIDPAQEVEWMRALTNSDGWVHRQLAPQVRDFDPGDQLETVGWEVTGGDPSRVVIERPDSVRTKVAFSAPGEYELTLTVGDGEQSRAQRVRFTVAMQRRQIVVDPSMADYSGSSVVDSGLFNQQDQAGDPPTGDLGSQWQFNWPVTYPVRFDVDLGQSYALSEVWLLDYNGIGRFRIYAGSEAEGWEAIVDFSTDQYLSWRRFEVEATTRYLRIERMDAGATVGEVILFGPGGGSSSTDLLKPLPLEPDLGYNPASGEARIGFHANAFHGYELWHSERLDSWKPLASWADSIPFPDYRHREAGPSGFYRIVEIPTSSPIE